MFAKSKLQQQQKQQQKTMPAKEFPAPCVMGDESIMSKKAHGTSEVCLLLPY
jgi:hypothetical protein